MTSTISRTTLTDTIVRASRVTLLRPDSAQGLPDGVIDAIIALAGEDDVTIVAANERLPLFEAELEGRVKGRVYYYSPQLAARRPAEFAGSEQPNVMYVDGDAIRNRKTSTYKNLKATVEQARALVIDLHQSSLPQGWRLLKDVTIIEMAGDVQAVQGPEAANRRAAEYEAEWKAIQAESMPGFVKDRIEATSAS